ncbi:MAG: glycosyltransferase family 39 protein [Ignavibacteriales bacterium]|nr:glycosyltransferase family 39 protein [Ignavibacteriales bacterium]
MDDEITHRETSSTYLIVPLSIALAQLVIQMLFHGNYGYFRDELYYIAGSKHLAFGYVDQPPLSLLILTAVRWVLGDSLHAIRFLPALAISATAILAALMALRLGGGRFASVLAALCVVAAPVLLGQGRYFSMNSFDVLFWGAACYVVIRILTDDTPKLWLLFGLVVGLGLQNKYSIGFLCIGLFAGLILTPDRKHLATKWFWLGVLTASLLFLPHVVWELKNGWPSLEFMRNASQLKNTPTTLLDFSALQLRELNYFCAPIWILGLTYFFFDSAGRRHRALAWTYVVVFIIMVAGNGKAYYLSPIYPMLFAGGSVFFERLTAKASGRWIKSVTVAGILLLMAISTPFAVPVLPVETLIAYQDFLGLKPRADERTSLGVLPQHYADEFGWEEMVAVIASAYHKLTPEEQAKCVIYVRNYGEAGAVDFFGPKYGLPNALCAHNSYWYWGPGEKTGDVAIIMGGRRNLQENLADLTRVYRNVELAGTTKLEYSMPYENGRQIFICKGMNTTFQKLWPEERFFI